ncbi:hypothetical protein V6N13_147603 [Hibiscus sabdariffa]|uniref:Uncharacterized protein n=1 Tax=Hibiscus sabdariffa TaxID=183260 RepID=A0ABR2TWU5_9ROSI
MEFLGFKNYWNDFLQRAETQVVTFRDKSVNHDTIVVCFKGTQLFSTDDWCSNVDLSWFQFAHIEKIHNSFLQSQIYCGEPQFGQRIGCSSFGDLVLPQGVLSGENAKSLYGTMRSRITWERT